MANSNPQSECCTLHTKAWLRVTKFTPSLTGILSACVACRAAGRRCGPGGSCGIRRSRAAISSLLRVRSSLYEPRLKLRRIYATPSSAVDVKGTGPFGFRGSRLDSGARCQREVHACRACLRCGLGSKTRSTGWLTYRITSFCPFIESLVKSLYGPIT
jgi:hypothetical protein